MNRYIEAQFQRIGFAIKDGKPVNEYDKKTDFARIQINFVNGSSNWLNLSNEQVEKLYLILSEGV